MGYYLPITDYTGQQYRRRVEDTGKSPYHIERKYRIKLGLIKSDEEPNRQLLYEQARRQKRDHEQRRKKRFSLDKGKVEGKGEQINVQV